MTEEDVKNFLTNNNGRLLIHMGTVDEKGEPNVFPTGYTTLTGIQTKFTLPHPRSQRKSVT
jgi:predicted pyridoxine 5'-phosphate oxidase superfamily flavin-nucleotide-binding protein